MITKAGLSDCTAVAGLALALWPSHTVGELQDELSCLIQREDAAVFLVWENGMPIAFAQCQLRRDYVEGTESSPVGYLEGIFVTEPRRKCGYARQLLSACEAWAKGRGCQEFASDCELENRHSLAFHLSTGFQEANRIVCFVKKL